MVFGNAENIVVLPGLDLTRLACSFDTDNREMLYSHGTAGTGFCLSSLCPRPQWRSIRMRVGAEVKIRTEEVVDGPFGDP